MKRSLLLLLVLVTAACSDNDSPAEGTAPTSTTVAVEEPSYILDITNQSFQDPQVRIVVRIDGEQVVDQNFDVEGQHTWVSFPFALTPGPHELQVEADSGATTEATIEIPADAPRYSSVGYWGPDDGGPVRFDLMTQDEPFLYA